MKKRLVALTLTCALAATALAGCGGSTGGDSTASGDSTATTETSTAATETSTAEGTSNRSRISSGRIWQKLTQRRPVYR